MKKWIAFFLALLVLFSLCACGEADSGAAFLGTYTLFAMDYDEDHIVFTEGLFEGSSYITLKSGGAAEICLEDDVANVRWKADGESLTITAADGDMAASVQDGVLTLQTEDSNLYFLQENASADQIKAITLDELLSGAVEESMQNAAEPEAATPVSAESEPSAIQQMWNGWYYGCIDMDGCTGAWEPINGETFDAVLYVELDRDGEGRLAIFDPFGVLISEEHSSIYVDAWCHADTQYLYADSGTAFDVEINPSDWRFVRNRDIPEKLHVGSESMEENGDRIGYDFQFKPWGDRWEGDAYTQFIPYFDAYIDAVDAGLSSPFDDSFTGFGIAEPLADNSGAPAVSGTPAASGGQSALLGANPARLDVNDRGVVAVSYPADQFVYDDLYGKLKNEETGVGILLDPMLGATNFEELKASYEEHNSDETDYSLVETTVNGCKALILKYSDWLGSTMRVDLDFGGCHDGWYGISFAVSGDALEDCDTELVWAIIESMELMK